LSHTIFRTDEIHINPSRIKNVAEINKIFYFLKPILKNNGTYGKNIIKLGGAVYLENTDSNFLMKVTVN
jgi:hypothetical protein